MEGSNLKVAFFDFEEVPQEVLVAWTDTINEIIRAGKFIGGDALAEFESSWARYLDVPYCIGVANGLDAITLSLKALGVESGMKVAVPSHTFIATWLAVANVGAIPIGIDCDDSGLMNLDLLEGLLENIDCVIPTHMHGQMVDMKRLISWTSPRGIKVIEDCAQAHGAQLENKYAGTWGDIGAFSFYPTKNLGAMGDAGAIVTSKKELAQIIRSLGNYGSNSENKYVYDRLGTNSRLDSIQAGILKVNLTYLDKWNLTRRSIAQTYYNFFDSLGIEHLPVKFDESVHHHCILYSNNRDQLREALQKFGIGTEIHYPFTAEDSFSKIIKYSPSNHHNARKIASRTLSLPISPWISAEKIEYVKKSFQTKEITKILSN